MRIRAVLCGFALVFGASLVAVAQDAAKVDPAHYKVVSENSQVRILHIHYGAHAKSVMHSHPDGVLVVLSATKVKFTYPDGKTEIREMKAGDSQFTPHTVHLPENMGDQPMDAILVELKK